MMKINKSLLPVKAHYFFFMGALGPIFPQIMVFGKQLGISPDVMGLITSILPILFVVAKPSVGFLADYFSNFRKFIFVSVILIMFLSFGGYYFIPQPIQHKIDLQREFNFSLQTADLKYCESQVTVNTALCTTSRKVMCHYSEDSIFSSYIQYFDSITTFQQNSTTFQFSNTTFHFCLSETSKIEWPESELQVKCTPDPNSVPECLYNTLTFWSFVILTCFGTIAFSVTNCINDAICFDILGENKKLKYGAQRVFGTIGFGFAAFAAGIAVDLATEGPVKSFTPAIIVMLIFATFELISVTKFKLPKFSQSDSIFRDVGTLLKQYSIAIFLVFATAAGMMDCFIIFFLFWHVEEIAAETGYMDSIKLIEGCIVAAQCLCGETLFFLISGKILKKIGYVHCLSLVFFAYSIRFGLISFIPNPWWLIPIELVMQGCTYALSYTCIVAYASAISPPGTSATVQGLVVSMDDGLGFTIGSLIGGQLYHNYGGKRTFQVFSVISLVTCISHIFLRPATKYENSKEYSAPTEQAEVTADPT